MENERDFEAEHDNFMRETIESYQSEIKKYTLEIKKGNNTTSNYAFLFQAFKALYEFTKNEKQYKCVDKENVEKICNQLLAKIKQDMDNNINMAENYCYLAYVYEYKENLPKALEYFDKAVELDPSNLLNRAGFKNHTLDDRQGALDDYNRALEIEKDPEQQEIIRHLIEHIDLIRNTDKDIKSFHIKTTLFIIAIVAYVLFKIYVIFFC